MPFFQDDKIEKITIVQVGKKERNIGNVPIQDFGKLGWLKP